jgi:hypothetical protein
MPAAVVTAHGASKADAAFSKSCQHVVCAEVGSVAAGICWGWGWLTIPMQGCH